MHILLYSNAVNLFITMSRPPYHLADDTNAGPSENKLSLHPNESTLLNVACNEIEYHWRICSAYSQDPSSVRTTRSTVLFRSAVDRRVAQASSNRLVGKLVNSANSPTLPTSSSSLAWPNTNWNRCCMVSSSCHRLLSRLPEPNMQTTRHRESVAEGAGSGGSDSKACSLAMVLQIFRACAALDRAHGETS